MFSHSKQNNVFGISHRVSSLLFHTLMLFIVIWNSAFVASPANAYDRPEGGFGIEASSNRAVFVHPSPNVGERNSKVQRDATAHDYGALIQCVSAHCPDSNSGVLATEEFEELADYRSTNFKILCAGKGCTQQNDVYYRVVYILDWRTVYVRTAQASAFASAYYGEGTGGLHDISCGTGKAGGCKLYTQGVISRDLIHQNPDRSFHLTIHTSGGPGEAYAYNFRKWFIQVSFDPALLTMPLPEDIACELCPADMVPYPTACGGFLCAYGNTQESVGDPINTRTGVMSYPVEDMSLAIRGGTLAFHRVYRSNATAATSLGYGWTHNHNARLVFSTDPGGEPGFVLFQAPDGNAYRFWDIGNGKYAPFTGFPGELTKSAGTYSLRTSSQLEFLFDSSGKLTRISDSQGHATAYSYGSDGRLSRVSADAETRYFDFTYDAQGFLTDVTDSAGRSVSFEYDSAGNLITSTDVLGQDWRYTYDFEHHLVQVIDPTGKTKVRTEYYSPPVIDFNSVSLSNFGNQDGAHTVSIEDQGRTLHLTGNTWKSIPLSYTITPNTIIEFDFKSTTQGEAHGIGFDSDNTVDLNHVFRLYGTESGGFNDSNKDYATFAPGWRHYKFQPYNYYRGKTFDWTQNLIYLFFANDHDIPNPVADSYFSNVRIYESTEPIGRAIRQFDGEGNLVVSLQYDSNGTTRVTDALGHQAVYTYDLRGALARIVNPLNEETAKTYDENFRPATIANAAGHTLTMVWSADGVNLLAKIDPAGNRTDMTYDALNNLTSIIDPRGFLTTYTYNGKLLTSKTDALNHATTYTYTPEGFLKTETDPAGRTTTYTYDSLGNRISETDFLGNVTAYTYNDVGLLVDVTDPLEVVTHNEYDIAGRLIRVTRNYDPGRPQNDENLYNLTIQYAYDARGNRNAVTDTLGRTTLYEYDSVGRLIRVTDPAGTVTTHQYNAAGQLIRTSDALGRSTTYEYDPTGRLVKTVNALGQAVSVITFDIATNSSSVEDAFGRATVTQFDPLGRPIKVVSPTGGSTITAYDENGNVIARTDPLGRQTTYEYDALNRLIKTIDPDGGVTETFYDSAGNRAATIDALGNATTYAYDSAGRLIAVTDPLGRVTQTEYDAYGRRAATIDAAGRRTVYTYDVLGRVIAIADPAGNITQTSYDALGNIIRRIDANGHTTITAYDSLNRPISITDANGNVVTNTYDSAGNLVAVTNGLGNTTAYMYDAMNRRIAETDPLGNIKRYEYDALDNLISETDANGIVTHYEFDALNRMTVMTQNYHPGIQPDAQTNVRVSYAYDLAGNRTSVTDANGHSADFEYDSLNRLTRKTDALNRFWFFEYDLAGNRISATDANGLSTRYAYDSARQLTDINYPAPDADVAFTYSLTGQRASMADGLGTTSWTYDDLDRVTAVTDPFGATVSYEYDNAGNRVGLAYPDGKPVVYAYDAGNRLISVTDWGGGITSYAYDAANRTVGISRPNGVDSIYTYDAADRLIALRHGDSSYRYTYDAAGNLIQAIEDLEHPLPPPPTQTPRPSDTGTPISTVTPTQTETPTETITPSNTETAAETPQPTIALTPEEAATPTATSLPAGPQTPDDISTPTETLILTDLPTDTPTPISTLIPMDTPTFSSTPTAVPAGPDTIQYNYDPLNRLISADFGFDTQFAYVYDPAGNVLEHRKLVGGDIVTTTYTYDDANQLSTAQIGSNEFWHYTYDNNGNLIQSTPSEGPAYGAKRYAYNAAGFLVRVDAFEDDWQTHAEMTYNAFGQRLQMRSSGVTARYVMDGNRPLVATSGGSATYYLYGLYPIGELTATWSYSLPDGKGIARQVTDTGGTVTFAANFSPWGEMFESFGQGDFTWNDSGGLMDAATGLLYVGNGQYYDPATGRFLTRGAEPNSSNPYVPRHGDPSGKFLAPPGLLPLIYKEKRTRRKWKILGALIALGMSVSLALSAYAGNGISAPQSTLAPIQPSQPVQSPPAVMDQGEGGDYTPAPIPPTPTPVFTPTCTLTSIPSPTPTPTNGQTLIYLGEWKITHYNYALERDTQFPADDKLPVSGLDQSRTYRRQFIYSQPGIYGQGTGRAENGEYITIDHWKNLQLYGPGWENSNPAYWYFLYGKGGRFKEGTPWASVAMAQTEPQLRYGDKVKIGIYMDKTFEVTDTGTFPDTSHLDVFIGETTHQYALDLGTIFNVAVWKVVE